MNILNSFNNWLKVKFSLENEKLDKNTLVYKILILGEPGVGKTSLCSRLVKNEFNLEIKPTENAELYTKTLKLFEYTIKLCLVDIDKNLMNKDRSIIYSDVKGALIIYDITKMKTFEKIDNWLLDIKQNIKEDLPIFIIGNKADLGNLRNVDSEEAIEKANLNNIEFFETTCVDNNSVKEVFKLLSSLIYFNDLSEDKKNILKVHFGSKIDMDNNDNDNYNDNDYENPSDNNMNNNNINIYNENKNGL
jgi:small GTP-binding protein